MVSYSHMESPESPIEDLGSVEGEIPRRFEIHYHTTGRINFTDMKNPSIFGEPLTSVTQNLWFASLIIPDFDRLDPHDDELTASDFILPLEGSGARRLQFDLCLSPSGTPIASYGFVRGHFSYPPFYTFNVIESDQQLRPGPGHGAKFSLVSPREGLFKTQQISREAAQIRYQQMRTGHSGPIVFGPTRDYVYRIIFPLPATVPPRIEAELGPGLNIDVLSATKSEARFRFLDARGALVRRPVQFTGIELGEYRLVIR